MKSKFLKIAFVIAVAMVGRINVFNTEKLEVLSDVALANVEALAGGDDDWYCVGEFGICYSDLEGMILGHYHDIEEEGPKE